MTTSFTGTGTETTGTNPVTLTTFKAHARIDIDDDDDYIESLLLAATRQVENQAWHWIKADTDTLYLDSFPSVIRLPKNPVRSVTSIQYVDTAGDTQTLNTDYYTYDIHNSPARIVPAAGCVWPDTYTEPASVIISYSIGYSDYSDAPQNLIHAIKLLAAQWYERREDAEEASLSAIPNGIKNIIGLENMRSYY